MDRTQISAVILAGGFSSRMGDFKPLLPIGQENPVSLLCKMLKVAGIEDVLVVTGHRRELLEPVLEGQGIPYIYNENYAEGMFTSIKAGIAAIAKASGETGEGAALLLPVDSPLIPALVLEQLIEKHTECPEAFVVPCFHGKKGHPLLIPARYYKEITEHTGENGLKGVTERHPEAFCRLETGCEAVVLDMDSPEDYQELLAYYKANRCPDEAACLTLLSAYKTPPHVVRHCKAVMETALRMAGALNAHGYHLDLPMVRAAGLLHDIARVEDAHWEKGARIAEKRSWYTLGELIRKHMFYSKSDQDESISELDMLCLGDRMVKEDEYVGLGNRMEYVLNKFSDDPQAQERIKMRLSEARNLKHRIEGIIGRTIETLITEQLPVVEEEPQPGKKPRSIYFVRHGQTQQHSGPILLGQTDVPLSELGREQALQAAKSLKSQLRRKVLVCSSDLVRAVETAEIIAKELGATVFVKEPAFREMALGDWDGKLVSEIKAEEPEEFQRRGREFLTYKKGNNSENFYDLLYRSAKALDKLLRQTDEDLIIVTHGGVIKMLLPYLRQEPEDKYLWERIKNCQIIEVDKNNI